MLWTAARVGCERATAIGFDVSKQLTALAHKSAVRNNFSCVDFRWGHVGDVFNGSATSMRNSHSQGLRRTTLDHEWGNEKIHIIKIHTNVDEEKVVKGAKRLIRTGVGYLIIHFGSDYRNLASGVKLLRLLESRGNYRCVAEDTEVDSTSIVKLWGLHGAIELICRRRDLQEWMKLALNQTFLT